MAQAKSLAEMSVNTLMMVSFAVPGGAPFGAALAVGGFLIGIFWPDGAMPSQYEPINKADLDAAIASLKDFFLTVLNAAKIADTTGAIETPTTHLNDVWQKILKIKLDGQGYHFLQDTTTQQFVAEVDKYLDAVSNDSVSQVADANLTKLRAGTVPTNQAAPVSLLIGSLMVSYLKLVVTWSWGREVLGCSEYEDYLIAHKKWVQACGNLPPGTNKPPEPMPPATTVKLPEWQDWSNGVGPVSDLITGVDRLVEEFDGPNGIYTTLAASWNDRALQVKTRMNQISLQNDGASPTNYWVEDSRPPGMKTLSNGDKLFSVAWAECITGNQVAYEWDYWTKFYSLQSVTADDITQGRIAIDLWKQIREDMKFQTRRVQPGDDLTAIARLFYTPLVVSLKLVESNPKVLADANLIAKGEVLLIPDLQNLAAPTQYTVKSGDTLITIATAIYADEKLATRIYEANKTLQSKALTTGSTLIIPDLIDRTKNTSYTVKAGDSLTLIASTVYTVADLVAKLQDANKNKVKGVVVIPDDVLKIPNL